MAQTKSRKPRPTLPAPPEAIDPGPSRSVRVRRWLRRRRPNWLGLVGAVLAFGAALTPSLLPRPWLFEGVIAGVGAAIGYGTGVLLSWLVRKLPLPEPSATVRTWAWRGLAVLGTAFAVYFLLLGVGWQNEVRELVGEQDEGLDTALVVGVVAVPVAIGCVLLGRALRRLTHGVAWLIDKLLPRAVSVALAVVLVALLVYGAVAGVLFRGFVSVMNNVYASDNAATADGVTAPTSPMRSGGQGSFAPWDTLGSQGRSFVAGGPTGQQIADFSGTTSKTPIRIYVGLDTKPTAQERAALAVQELERTDAWSRKVLVVAGTTGTGWIEPQAVDSLEYEWNGDTATVAIQYSYLPSWISTLVDVDKAREAGQALFDAVYAAWSKEPAATRPMLVAYGLSLGSFSSQSAFTDAADITSRTQGAVFVGSPNFSQPWGQISADRDPGSPQWQPIYAAGANIRFASSPPDLDQPTTPWADPRVAYLQHANDPVVWWSPALIAQQPDWLAEPPGPGRTPTMRWYPVLTFLQVTVDQFVGVDVPQGQGHNYGTAMPATWAAVTQPPGWTQAKTDKLTQLIAGMPTG
ncbi:MAG: hypothetical protein GC157_11115 [Frankiales bacterium]|nr:hypothetical protein [Frankiales bacterium]